MFTMSHSKGKQVVFFTMDNTEETLDFEQKHKEDLQRLRGSVF